MRLATASLCLLLVLTLPAAAQPLPAGAERDLWCGIAFDVMTRDAPADTTDEKRAAAAAYVDGGRRLRDRAELALLESGWTEETVSGFAARLDTEVVRSINESADRYPPRFTFQECSALIGQ
jgi:hypothetical protein